MRDVVSTQRYQASVAHMALVHETRLAQYTPVVAAGGLGHRQIEGGAGMLALVAAEQLDDDVPAHRIGQRREDCVELDRIPIWLVCEHRVGWHHSSCQVR